MKILNQLKWGSALALMIVAIGCGSDSKKSGESKALQDADIITFPANDTPGAMDALKAPSALYGLKQVRSYDVHKNGKFLFNLSLSKVAAPSKEADKPIVKTIWNKEDQDMLHIIFVSYFVPLKVNATGSSLVMDEKRNFSMQISNKENGSLTIDSKDNEPDFASMLFSPATPKDGNIYKFEFMRGIAIKKDSNLVFYIESKQGDESSVLELTYEKIGEAVADKSIIAPSEVPAPAPAPATQPEAAKNMSETQSIQCQSKDGLELYLDVSKISDFSNPELGIGYRPNTGGDFIASKSSSPFVSRSNEFTTIEAGSSVEIVTEDFLDITKEFSSSFKDKEGKSHLLSSCKFFKAKLYPDFKY